MSIKKSINKLKIGEKESTEKAKEKIKKAFKKEEEKASKQMMGRLKDYSSIEKEKGKIAFIYGLKLAARSRGREFFPLFTKFITDNIQSDSGNVRQAVIRLTDTLIESLLVDSEDLSKKEKEVFNQFIDEILMLLENYHDFEYEEYSDISNMPPSVYKSLEILLSKIMNPGQKKTSYDRKTGMPGWMDCTWKRIPCGEDNCPVCSKLNELENADLFERNEFLMNAAEEDGSGEEKIPNPEDFPFYIEVRDWLDELLLIAEKSRERGEFWIFTEEAADLFWYMNVLSAKTYRQLSNRYLIENSGKNNKVNYNYTNYVLKESVKKIKKSLKIIADNNQSQRSELEDAFEKISDMEERIFNI